LKFAILISFMCLVIFFFYDQMPLAGGHSG